jgi:hypothetical protein
MRVVGFGPCLQSRNEDLRGRVQKDTCNYPVSFSAKCTGRPFALLDLVVGWPSQIAE